MLFAVGLAAAARPARRWRDVAALAATALPMLLWQAYLTAHGAGADDRRLPALLELPMAGAFPIADLDPARLAALLPGRPAGWLALLPGALAWIAREPESPYGWLIALSTLLVLIAPAQSLLHVLGLARVAVGAVVALSARLPGPVARDARRGRGRRGGADADLAAADAVVGAVDGGRDDEDELDGRTVRGLDASAAPIPQHGIASSTQDAAQSQSERSLI